LISAIWLLPKLIMVILQVLIYYLPMGVFRCCLPTDVKSRVRFARRFTVKAGVGLEQNIEMKMAAYQSTLRPRKGYIDSKGKDVPLSSFLRVYDILILVARELHHVDIVTLACTSRSVREAVLPAYDFDRRLSVFNLYTCDGPKKSCWLCTNKICKVCNQLPRAS
jgi:hypothetical protein